MSLEYSRHLVIVIFCSIFIYKKTVPEIRSETDRIVCHFGPLFAILPRNNPENQNFEKMKKASGDCHHFTCVYQKSQSNDVCFLRYGVRKTFLKNWDHFLPFYPSIDPKN